MNDALFQELQQNIKGVCLLNHPLAQYTTWKVGGNADIFVEAVNEADVSACLHFVNRHQLPFTVIGNGSNMLVLDSGVRGVVLRLGGEFRNFTVLQRTIYAGAGITLPRLSRETAKHGLAGLEFAVGIPGSLGGATVMNAGIPGSSLSDVVRSVKLISNEGDIHHLDKERLNFGYRSSNLDPKRETVLWVELELEYGDAGEIQRITNEQVEKRRINQPTNYPNAGSVFKNPPKYAAGYLIEAAGLKGIRRGGASISERHGNFIINDNQASAQDMLALISLIQEEVERQFNINLELEVHIIGEEN